MQRRPERSAAIAAEQRLNAGAVPDERFLFMSGQVLDLALDFQGPPFFPNLFFKNQFQGTAPTKVFCCRVGA